jgi:Zn-dependent protease with chaperone function
VLAALFPAAARAQTHEDQHVSALSAHRLLSSSPVSLVDPVRQRRAKTIADLQTVAFVAWAFAPILAFFYLWNSGNAARIRDVLRRRFRYPFVVRAAFGAVLGIIGTLAMLPFAFAYYRIAANVGLTRQPIPSWLFAEIARIGVVALCSAIAVAVVLELVDRTRLWYVAFIAFLYVVALATVAIEPVLLSPLASHHRPAPASIVALGDAVAHRLGTLPVSIEIATEASRSGISPARTSGLGPFTQIVLDNDGLARATEAERRYILARQYAHVMRHDVLALTLWGVTLFVIAGALAVLISDRIRFRRDDDPLARLALVGTFLGLMVIGILPAFTAIERNVESRADLIALGVTKDPAAAVRLFVRTADDNLVPLCGRRTTRWYFDARRPLGSRIATASGRPDPCPR